MIANSTATPKPRSMKAGARNVLRSNDSASLWNCTLSPGWTEQESEILRQLAIKFGIGNWAKIIESDCLPGKTNAQMNLQLQRLLGQQSTAEFAGLHIDPKVIGEKNSKIQGPHIKRKNTTIVNTGGKLSREELRERQAKNKEMYEMPKSAWDSIDLDELRDMNSLKLKKKEDKDALKKQKLTQLKTKLTKSQNNLKKVQAELKQIAMVDPERVAELKKELSRASSPLSNEVSVIEESPAKKQRTS
ncbi:hypothetical protein DM01DRAFT_1320556 [Hesseltinella vesiculosa]|uniref:Myb-like domain-containing protein n=1 Tax=Hesseltinella vesiculosa TaxID=101127 RepID=A0A1X2GL51_9FUNG|nr:hypothetical protein DM01DRAFT_1320556 [Hesseltinella vesiculosa]